MQSTAIRHALARLPRLRPTLGHGVLEIDNNPAERAMRGVALGRTITLFVGSQAGRRAAATATATAITTTLIETAELNGVDPHSCLAAPPARIPDHTITRSDEPLPWHHR